MSKCVFCLIDYNRIIILLSVTVFVCHDKGLVFCTINSPVYVYWTQQQKNIHNELSYYRNKLLQKYQSFIVIPFLKILRAYTNNNLSSLSGEPLMS